jgi:hypothetical protein
MTENDGGLARPGETRRESHDKIPSGKTTLFQQLVGNVRHCGDDIAKENGVLAERQPLRRWCTYMGSSVTTVLNNPIADIIPVQ